MAKSQPPSCINCTHAAKLPNEPQTRAEWLADPHRGADGICPHTDEQLPRWVLCTIPLKDGRQVPAHRLYKCSEYQKAGTNRDG